MSEMLSSQMQAQQISSEHSSKDEAEYCPICYSTEIVVHPTPVDALTWEFSCKHRFCRDCARENLKLKIMEHNIDQLVCPQGCGTKVNIDELQVLFKDEKQILTKLKEVIAKQQLEHDPLTRWCTKQGCSGVMRGSSLDTKTVQCPICST